MAKKFISYHETSNHKLRLQNFVIRLRILYRIEELIKIVCENKLVIMYFNNNMSLTKFKYISNS